MVQYHEVLRHNFLSEMEQPASGKSEHVLAVAMLAATQMRQELPPSAFARITTWSHGQASVDTGECSTWGNAEPVFLPMSRECRMDTAIELEVSLWETRQGKSGPVSIMFDAVGEVFLPAPEDLGTSEQEAIRR